MNKDKIYYVYIHIFEGDPVYVGKGKEGRAWSLDRYNDIHVAMLTEAHSKGDFNYVKMFRTGLTSEEAVDIEKEVIDILQMDFLLLQTHHKHKPKSTFKEKSTEDKLLFFSECGKKGGRPKGSKDKTKRKAGSGRPKKITPNTN